MSNPNNLFGIPVVVSDMVPFGQWYVLSDGKLSPEQEGALKAMEEDVARVERCLILAARPGATLIVARDVAEQFARSIGDIERTNEK